MRTATKGRFPLAKVFVIPTLTKPSDALVQMYANASRADLLREPSTNQTNLDAAKHADETIGNPEIAPNSKARWGKIRGSLPDTVAKARWGNVHGSLSPTPEIATTPKARWGIIRGSL